MRRCFTLCRSRIANPFTLSKTLEPDDKHQDLAGFDDEVLNRKCPDNISAVKDNEIVVWVDPLDGTSEYTQGLLDHVTVLIGVAVRGKAVGGVIHQPFYNYKVIFPI